ncbi:MAG: DMT family transporter, partial [Alphaproteobacteria bacterium]|nr:DMT family transporter [Alphaproteobacteria bacterium]
MTGEDRPAGLPPAVPAAVWMLLGCLCFSSMNGVVRHLSQQELPTLVIVFFRSLFGLLAMLPWLLRPGLASLRPGRIDLHTLRVALALVAMVAWFYGLGLMPLAEATALSFTTPLFASIAAVLILGEVMRARRWTAILVGFAGAMIILRPGFAEFSTATACVLGAAL